MSKREEKSTVQIQESPERIKKGGIYILKKSSHMVFNVYVPGVLLASSETALAMSISLQPPPYTVLHTTAVQGKGCGTGHYPFHCAELQLLAVCNFWRTLLNR
jgi:hypothetical protein